MHDEFNWIEPHRYYWRGCHFRSRLEVEWANQLTHLGLDWIYEPRVIRLDYNTWYRPDFLVNMGESRWWLEVKGDHNQRMDKARKLAAREALAIGRPPADGRTHLETVNGELLVLGRCKGDQTMRDVEVERDGVWVPDGQIPGWSHTLPYRPSTPRASGTCAAPYCKADVTLNPEASGHEWSGLPADAVRTQ